MRDGLTVDERAVEPLDVIVFGEREQDLVTDDGERQQEHGSTRHCQGEGAQVQSAEDTHTHTHTHTCTHTHTHIYLVTEAAVPSSPYL